MTTTEQILLGALAMNALGTVSLWMNHQFSAKGERKDLDKRLRKMEVKVGRIMERLGMKEEDET